MNTPLAHKNMDLGATWKYPSGGIHAGYDYEVGIGTPVFAVRNGRILKVVDTIANLDPNVEGHTGDPPNFILQGITYNREPATVVYLHLSPGVLVKEGDEVEAGQRIALSGHNGHSTAPHLHVSAMKGHHFAPFDYLDGLSDASPEPTSGVASNDVTIFPPRLVYPRQPPHHLARGRIVLEDLHVGVTGSDTVKRLQHRLNQIPLEGGVELPVTGNYLDQTKAEVMKWQIQKRHAKPGTEMANGELHPQQARILFGKRFDFVHAHDG